MSSDSSVSLPKCFVDGLPCFNNGQCEISTFGVLGDAVVWRCPRFRLGGDSSQKRVLDEIDRKYVKK